MRARFHFQITRLLNFQFFVFGLERSPQDRKKQSNSAQTALDFSFYSLYDPPMKSIRDILREEMEECTEVRANESAILNFYRCAGRKKPGLVELENEGLLIGGDC